MILFISFISIIGSGMAFAASPAGNENDSNAMQAKQEISSPAKYKKVINIDVKTLENRKFVRFGGPYIFEEGDIIQYDITAEGNNENLTIEFFREDATTCYSKGNLQVVTLMGSHIQNSDQRVKITQSQAGSYCLIIGNCTGEVPSNIKGTIEITKLK